MTFGRPSSILDEHVRLEMPALFPNSQPADDDGTEALTIDFFNSTMWVLRPRLVESLQTNNQKRSVRYNVSYH